MFKCSRDLLIVYDIEREELVFLYNCSTPDDRMRGTDEALMSRNRFITSDALRLNDDDQPKRYTKPTSLYTDPSSERALSDDDDGQIPSDDQEL